MAKENGLFGSIAYKIEEISNARSFKVLLILIAVEVAYFALKEFWMGFKDGVASVIGG